MKRSTVAFLIFLFFAPHVTDAQQIIINELYNSAGTDEWAELLVVQDSLDLRGWDLRDFSSGGSAQQPLTFTTTNLWSSVRKGTIIIVGTAATTFTEDTDPSDYLLIVKANNASYFTATGVFSFAGNSDAFQLRDGSGTHIFGVSWGTANAGSLSSPKVHFTGSVAGGNTIYFNEDSLPELTSTSNWTFSTGTQSPGTGNTATNSAWIASLRVQNEAVGTGTARVQPDIVFSSSPVPTLIFSIRQDSTYTLTYVSIYVPPEWTWSHLSSDIQLAGAGFQSASVTVNSDTIVINQATLTTNDSGTVTINNLESPPVKGYYTFGVRTSIESGTPSPILRQPRVRVLELVPIVLVHVNDSQGVPAPPYQAGAEVTVTGIVTANLSTVRTDVYVQDETAGIDIFSFDTLSTPLLAGDSITVTGSILQFRGLTEISPEFALLRRHAAGRPVPAPVVLTCADVNNTFQIDFTEPNEGRLIRINGASYNQAASTISDASGTTNIFIPGSFPPTPSVFDVIGILKQYKPGTPAPGPPYTADYEIAPRTPDDIIAHPGPVITSNPSEDNIQPTSVRLQWTTNVSSSSIVRYGTTTSFTDSLADTTRTVSHAVTLTNLSTATVYHYSVGSGDENGTNFSPNFIFSTASPPGTTGQVNVYFNKSIDPSVSTGETALGNEDLISRVVTRINNSHRSIDACLYSLSANGQGDVVASALIAAKNRGVKVRVICEADNQNSGGSSYPMLSSNGIIVLNDAFDPVNNGAGLMHNKFFVFDYRGGAPESIWVWTGSWNPTFQGTTSDRQNSIEIQDVALAGAYTLEFNEMWGSDTDTPNQAASRFGVRKTDNTPHNFAINLIPVSLFFSPTDRSTSYIRSTLARAQHNVSVAMLSFTRSDVADTLIARKNAGRKVRVVMDNNTDSGNQYSHLLSNLVDVLLRGGSGLLHHKYAVVDGDRITATSYAITGSQNWSNSGENSNNENTLIIQSARVANLYLQEFAARYYEAGGNDSILLAVQEIGGIPQAFSLSQNYPNPFNPSTAIYYDLPVAGRVSLTVYNLLGQEVVTLVDEEQKVGRYKVEFNAASFASGLYFYRLSAGTFYAVKKMLLLK